MIMFFMGYIVVGIALVVMGFCVSYSGMQNKSPAEEALGDWLLVVGTFYTSVFGSLWWMAA